MPYQFEADSVFKHKRGMSWGDFLLLIDWLINDKVQRDGMASVPPEIRALIELAPASEGFKS